MLLFQWKQRTVCHIIDFLHTVCSLIWNDTVIFNSNENAKLFIYISQSKSTCQVSNKLVHCHKAQQINKKYKIYNKVGEKEQARFCPLFLDILVYLPPLVPDHFDFNFASTSTQAFHLWLLLFLFSVLLCAH